MLIEFSVSNFRSIRDRVTLSMVAQESDNVLPENIIQGDDLPGLKNHNFLSAAAIYGANASGKSNLIRAFAFMQTTVVKSFTDMKPTDIFSFSPYLFCPNATKTPSEFEVIFTHEGIRYQYELSLTQERVHEESLHSFAEGRPKMVFTREYDEAEDDYEYEYGDEFGTEKNLGEQTRPNALLLSVGAQFNNKVTTRIYKWFVKRVNMLNLSVSGHLPDQYTSILMKEGSEQFKHSIEKMIQDADLGIKSLEIKEVAVDKIQFPSDIPEEAKDKLLEQLEKNPLYDVKFKHHADTGSTQDTLDIEEESAGTQRLFALLGPIYDTLEKGDILFIDEIGASLHPELTRALIRLFATQNPHGAQLIFTTHNTTLLDSQNLLRRDQYWFTEKDHDGVSHLIPLSDFSPRKNEALQKGYLAGRYGAVPILSGNLAPSE